MPVTAVGLGQATAIPRILTLRAEGSAGHLELTCSTMGGTVAATLRWPDNAPVTNLAPAIIAAVRSSGFTGLKEPLAVWNLRVLKPDGTSLDLGADAPLLPQQFGIAKNVSLDTATPMPMGLLKRESEAEG